MGTSARLWVHGGPHDLAARLEGRVEELEAAWSRFRDDSDVSRMNETHAPTQVGVDTIDLVRHALLASWETAGWFDPTLGLEVTAAGYDRDFAELEPLQEGFVMTVDANTRTLTRVRPWRGRCAAIDVNVAEATVSIPDGVAFDAGGIGKGRAADLVARQALELGATSVLIDIGGDLRLAGTPPAGGWRVEVEDPGNPVTPLITLRVDAGGVATSSSIRRRWSTAEGPRHHVLDPATGTSSTSNVNTATVIATEAWWAEALATAAVVAGVDQALELLHASGATGLVVDSNGVRHDAHDLEPFLC
jgi:thiamine biosynthesis lipoprotein